MKLASPAISQEDSIGISPMISETQWVSEGRAIHFKGGYVKGEINHNVTFAGQFLNGTIPSATCRCHKSPDGFCPECLWLPGLVQHRLGFSSRSCGIVCELLSSVILELHYFLTMLFLLLAGLCALSINHSNSYVAYPGSPVVGEIVLYDGNLLVGANMNRKGILGHRFGNSVA